MPPQQLLPSLLPSEPALHDCKSCPHRELNCSPLDRSQRQQHHSNSNQASQQQPLQQSKLLSVLPIGANHSCHSLLSTAIFICALQGIRPTSYARNKVFTISYRLQQTFPNTRTCHKSPKTRPRHRQRRYDNNMERVVWLCLNSRAAVHVALFNALC